MLFRRIPKDEFKFEGRKLELDYLKKGNYRSNF